MAVEKFTLRSQRYTAMKLVFFQYVEMALDHDFTGDAFELLGSPVGGRLVAASTNA